MKVRMHYFILCAHYLYAITYTRFKDEETRSVSGTEVFTYNLEGTQLHHMTVYRPESASLVDFGTFLHTRVAS
jgi:hypothetical protein